MYFFISLFYFIFYSPWPLAMSALVAPPPFVWLFSMTDAGWWRMSPHKLRESGERAISRGVARDARSRRHDGDRLQELVSPGWVSSHDRTATHQSIFSSRRHIRFFIAWSTAVGPRVNPTTHFACSVQQQTAPVQPIPCDWDIGSLHPRRDWGHPCLSGKHTRSVYCWSSSNHERIQ